MADFDLTQTDAQVQSILNDAQDAQGAGAQTTLTTDYIMLKDTSGNYHKILKDSFTEACRNVLAGLLVNNDKGTTISQIPAIASGDFGSVTPANLASVLGGVQRQITDCNNATEGWNMIPASETNAHKPSVVPAKTLWLYHHVTNTQYDNAIQLGFVTADDAVSAYYRPKQDGVFLDWQRFTLTAVV